MLFCPTHRLAALLVLVDGVHFGQELQTKGEFQPGLSTKGLPMLFQFFPVASRIPLGSRVRASLSTQRAHRR